jgi:hypothetical protein
VDRGQKNYAFSGEGFRDSLWFSHVINKKAHMGKKKEITLDRYRFSSDTIKGYLCSLFVSNII